MPLYVALPDCLARFNLVDALGHNLANDRLPSIRRRRDLWGRCNSRQVTTAQGESFDRQRKVVGRSAFVIFQSSIHSEEVQDEKRMEEL